MSKYSRHNPDEPVRHDWYAGATRTKTETPLTKTAGSADKETLSTLCSQCQKPLTCQWDKEMTFGGEKVTASEYMARALRSKNVQIVCDDCLQKMPDVRVEDMRACPPNNIDRI